MNDSLTSLVLQCDCDVAVEFV